MKKVPAGEFKQICLRLLDEVGETGEPIVITKRGRPVAQLAPLERGVAPAWAGAMRATGEILGDLVEPALGSEAWGAEHE